MLINKGNTDTLGGKYNWEDSVQIAKHGCSLTFFALCTLSFQINELLQISVFPPATMNKALLADLYS